jgi:hypothetical protein
MLRLKRLAHIHTSRTIKGFRSCKHFTAFSLTHFEPGRIAFEEERIGMRNALRKRQGRRPSRPAFIVVRSVPDCGKHERGRPNV